MANSSDITDLKVKNKLDKIRYDCNIKQGDFNKIILDTSKEVLDSIFGVEIAAIVLNKLHNDDIQNNSDIKLEKYLGKLDNYFGNDSVHISKMIEGKVLAKCHQMEIMKKIQLPLSED